jgi:hypothetical protein
MSALPKIYGASDRAILRRPIAFSIRRPVLAKASDDQVTPSSACSVFEGVVPVRTIDDRNQTDIVAEVRTAARALVEREHRLTLSRMLAYERVAASVGTSAGWLRKFVNAYPDAKPDLVVGFNILAHHARVTSPRS